MSHTTTIELEIKSLTALKTACHETSTPYEEMTPVRLYDGTIIGTQPITCRIWVFW